jgi:hypothetical protein
MMVINPIYAHLSPTLNSTREELEFGPSLPDFSIDQRTWCKTCQKIALLVLKIALFPWFLFEVVRWVTQRLLMASLYPAQSSYVKCFKKTAHRTANLDLCRLQIPEQLAGGHPIIRHVRLEKDGISFSGLLLSTAATIQNGKWILQATGSHEPIERAAHLLEAYQTVGFNLLMVNGPGVGRSEGMANAETLGDPQEMGITFLETAINANRVVIAGFSLGGAAIGRAIEEHEFKVDEKNYLVIRQMSFDKVSNVGRKMFRKKGSCLTHFSRFLTWLGKIEIDNLTSSKRLLELNIPEEIIQSGDADTFTDDGIVMEKATLGRRLKKEGIVHPELKSFRNVPNSGHTMPIESTLDAIRDWELRIDN